MSYFIFLKNTNNIEGSLYRIAENQSDLNNLNIIQSEYKIIEESQTNFDNVKYGINNVVKYNNDTIVYGEANINFQDFSKDGVVIKTAKEYLNEYIIYCKNIIKQFTNNNTNHPLFNKWNDYYTQLNNLNLDSIQYPLNTSLEQYFKDQNLPSLNPLQIP